MASRTTISLVDDMDGSEAAETVTFELGSQRYEIDLTAEHAAILRGIFGPYIEAARRLASSTPRPTRTDRRGSRAGDVEPAAVRQWATENGLHVSPRGRLPQDLVKRFAEAQSAPQAEPEAAAVKPSRGTRRRKKGP